MTANIAITIEASVAEETQRSFGHNPNMQEDSCLQHTNPSDLSNNQEDPLEHPEAIEVVQQSDTTFVNDCDDDGNTNDISTWSMPAIRNLMGAFEDMKDLNEEQLLLSPEEGLLDNKRGGRYTSPNGVDQYGENNGSSKSNPSLTKANASFPFTLKIEMPHFRLYDGLKISLSQPVIDRCSLYSVIHGVNKEVQDMAAQDQNCIVEETMDESSALVRAVNGPKKHSSKYCSSPAELAVLDEEKFLLAAISSRSDEEMMIRACPASFAEAIGEVDAMSVSDNGYTNVHSENPLSVLSASRTQLWKPSRSWWEAKSGKNPWIEPKLHNKRWR